MAKQKPPPSPPSTTATRTRSSKISFRSRKPHKPSSTTKPPKLTVTPTTPPHPQPPNHLISLALDHLRDSDPRLAPLINSLPAPTTTLDPSHPQTPPFVSLTKSILFQQLATKAAKAIYTRFTSLCGGTEAHILPDVVSSLSAGQLRQIGVSGRKASYLHDLAGKFGDGELSDSLIMEMEDGDLLGRLTRVKGIGVWSVHMFMIFGLRRLDVWPVGDLGVRKGVRELYGLRELPNAVKMEEVGESWRPYRSIGAWYMWRFMEVKGVLPNTTVEGGATFDVGSSSTKIA